MADQPANSGIEEFWEYADDTDSDENPLERELADQIDALARYRRMIQECEEAGRDDQVRVLLKQHERVQRTVDELRQAMSGRSG